MRKPMPSRPPLSQGKASRTLATTMRRLNPGIPEGAVLIARGVGFKPEPDKVREATQTEPQAAPSAPVRRRMPLPSGSEPETAPATSEASERAVAGDDLCMVMMAKWVPRKQAEEWARYYAPRMATPIVLHFKNGTKIRFDKLNAEHAEYRPFGFAWAPNWDTRWEGWKTNNKASEAAAKPAVTNGATPPRKAATKPAPGAPNKSDQVVALLQRKGGCTLEEVNTITGWTAGRNFLQRQATKLKKNLLTLPNGHYRLQ
jgi:hypothetical protein